MRIHKDSTVKKVFVTILEGLCVIFCMGLFYWTSKFFISARFNEFVSDSISIIFLAIFVFAYFRYRISRKKKKVFELSDEQQQILQSVLPIGIFTVDLNKRITSWNSAAQEITGYASEDVFGKECKLFTQHPCREHCGLYDDAISKPIKNVECLIETKDGSIRTILKRADFIKDHLGQVVGGVECFEDITDRRAAEKKLKDSEERFRTVFENSAVAITVTDKEERIVSWNSYAEKILGRNRKELHLKLISSLYPEAEWKRIRSLNIRKSGYRDHLETVMIRGDGSFVDVDISISILKDADDNVIGSIGVLRDITDRKKTEKQLVESEKRFRTIFENSAVAITLTDREERIVSWNHYAEEMLKKTYDDLHLKPISSLYEPEEWKRIRSLGLRNKGPQHHFESKMLKKDGSLVDVDISVTILKEDDGSIAGSLGVIRDITSIKKVESDLRLANQDLRANEQALRAILEDLNKTHVELKDAQKELLERQKQLVEEHKKQVMLTEQAEASTKAKTDFLSNMSHEVRTPLNSIIGFSQLLRKNVQDEKQKKFVDIIESSSQHLLTLINNILDYEKSIAGQIILDDTRIDIRLLSHDVFRVLGGSISDRPIEIGFEVNAEVPKEVFGDELKLKQVLMNLLSNALKFTKQGSVQLKVSVEEICQEEGAHRYYLRFSMEDTGIGIATDIKDKIFEQFTQADSSITRHFGGTGLGLSICKSYVELMGGKIWIESEEGKGSKFIFVAPFYDHSKREIVQSVFNEDSKNDLNGMRVLLAENHRVYQEEFKRFFNELKCHMDIVVDGDALINQIQKEMYDICFVNVQLPNFSGVAAVKKIREEINETIPIIAIATATFFEDKGHCREVGMEDFVSTPLSIDDLKEKLIVYIKKKPA
ncbi:MAG: PAS domain S-box protein [Candidatus Omnitrophica bacterium]|nr:PAS domain S-box protein [Candidatus Omnitrophota bacterium]